MAGPATAGPQANVRKQRSRRNHENRRNHPNHRRPENLTTLSRIEGGPSIRHQYASLLFQKNFRPKFVQELLWQAFVAIILDTYSHMLHGMGGEAAEAIGEALS